MSPLSFLRSARLAAGPSAVALAVVLTAAPAGAATATTGEAPATPPASVSRGVCASSLDDPNGRAAGFVVKLSRGTATAYGFTAVLQEKPRDGSWTTLTGAASPSGLGSFQPAVAGAPAMVRRINVRGLRMGSSYRLKVSFRWTSAQGKQTQVRRSTACTVKDLRPNLGVARVLGWRPGTSGDQVLYAAQLRVSRPALLADRTVTLSVRQDGVLLGSTVVTDPTHGETVLVPAARCARGRDITVTIDAAPTLDERNAADNALTVACPDERAARR